MKISRVAIAVTLLALIGCARSNDNAQPTDTATPDATTPAPTPCHVQGAAAAAIEEESSEETAPVTDVRYNDENCPRIVFQFSGDHTPGYKIEYVSPPFTDCGAGQTIDTSTWGADNFIEIRMFPSGGVDLSKGYEPTYKGPRDIDVKGDVLKHMKVTCDFEAVFTWLVGLDGKHPFKLEKLSNPSRMILDISAAGS
jgi:hypothetical protein